MPEMIPLPPPPPPRWQAVVFIVCALFTLYTAFIQPERRYFALFVVVVAGALMWKRYRDARGHRSSAIRPESEA